MDIADATIPEGNDESEQYRRKEKIKMKYEVM
jgi:hypothetical protein